MRLGSCTRPSGHFAREMPGYILHDSALTQAANTLPPARVSCAPGIVGSARRPPTDGCAQSARQQPTISAPRTYFFRLRTHTLSINKIRPEPKLCAPVRCSTDGKSRRETGSPVTTNLLPKTGQRAGFDHAVPYALATMLIAKEKGMFPYLSAASRPDSGPRRFQPQPGKRTSDSGTTLQPQNRACWPERHTGANGSPVHRGI